MARRITIQRYPLLKWTLPAGILLAIVGVAMFLTHSADCTAGIAPQQGCTAGSRYHDYNTLSLLAWVIPAVLVALLGLAVRRKETVTVLLPTDTLAETSRPELERLLEGLDEARRKGELTDERYVKARNRVLAQMGKK